MAKNVELMGAVFPDCPAVMLPTHEGPLARFTDVSDSQAVAADVAQGKQFYLADGTKATGTNQGGGGGGGGGGTIKPNARLVLIDYDGSIVDSYTQSEIDALSALPDAPDHSGDEIPLTSQGWNWTLAEIREQLTAMPEQVVYVGNVVIPSDGKTHIVIYIDENSPSNRLTTTVRMQQSTSYGVKVDWGDGTSPETYSGTSARNCHHTYATGGQYDVTLTVTSGTLTFNTNSSISIYGASDSRYTHRRGQIRKVYIGNGWATSGITQYLFNYCEALETVTIPNGIKTIGASAFVYCENLTACVIPKGITSYGSYTFRYCHAMSRVALPPDLPEMKSGMFQENFRLDGMTVPKGATFVSFTCWNNCKILTSLYLPEGVTGIDDNAAQNCYNLTHLTIPSTVTSIGSNAFGNNLGISVYHIKPTTPPTLTSVNAFNGIGSDAIMYVPYSADHSILAAYQGAANWSTYASQMQEEAE